MDVRRSYEPRSMVSCVVHSLSDQSAGSGPTHVVLDEVL